LGHPLVSDFRDFGPIRGESDVFGEPEEEEKEEEDFNPLIKYHNWYAEGLRTLERRARDFEMAYLAEREEEDFDLTIISTCTECKTLSWNEEIGVCHSCNYRLHGPKCSFYEDKLKYLELYLIRR